MCLLSQVAMNCEQYERAFDNLTAEQRYLLSLSMQGFGLTEIAEKLGINGGALRARLTRARESFGRFLKQYNAGK